MESHLNLINVHCQPYNLPLAKEECVNADIHSVLENGIIKPSGSPYSAPNVLERKMGHINSVLTIANSMQSQNFSVLHCQM